jgi:DNA repair exonuclease SbcCD ATPase subunit
VRPLRLVLSGFRSFRAEQILDFDGLGLVAIVGEAGAGKSSILEAIVYALYNKSTLGEAEAKHLIALGAETMQVAFDFEIDAIRYRVARSASLATGRLALHALRRLDDPLYHFDGETQVNEEIRRLCGLEYDSFIKAITLSQGRFADLLTAKDADRSRVLGELFGLADIDRVREMLEQSYERSRDLCASLHAKLEILGRDPAGRAAAARGELALASGRLASVTAELCALYAVLIHSRRLETLEESAEDLRRRLAVAWPRHEAALREREEARDADAEIGVDAELLSAVEELRECEESWSRVERVVAAALAGADQAVRILEDFEIRDDDLVPTRVRYGASEGIEWGARLRAWADRYRPKVEAAEADARAALRSAEQRLAALLGEGDSPEVAEPARLARGIAERLAAADALMRTLEHLRYYLRSNEFKEYVMRLRERGLLGVATEILRKMTADRYAFAEGFGILDAQTHAVRAPQSLAGGEKFLASFALALGLVDLAPQARRVGALFFDEWSGSPDGASLEVALAELADRAGSGKMICVITHVRGVAALAGTVFRVQRQAGGSVVSRLSDDERERFIDDALASMLQEAPR